MQTVPVLMDSGSITTVLQPLLSIFGLKPANSASGGVCLFSGLDGMGKLVLPLLVCIAFLAAICLLLLLISTLHGRRVAQLDGSSGMPKPLQWVLISLMCL